MNGEENMNSAEKAAKAREAKENAKRAKRQARRESVGNFFGAIGNFFASIIDAILSFFKLIGVGIWKLFKLIGIGCRYVFNFFTNFHTIAVLFLCSCAACFVLEAIGASDRSVVAITMQQITFYVSIGLFVLDVIFTVYYLGYDGEIDELYTVSYGASGLVIGIAIFVMGCVTLGMGRLNIFKSTYYDEVSGVVYAELDAGYVVWEIKPEQENVTILSEYNGLAVTGLRDHAAMGNTKMKSLIFSPGGKYTIEPYSLENCAALIDIHFGESSKFEISENVFLNCTRLATFDCGTENTIKILGAALGDVDVVVGTNSAVEIYGRVGSYHFRERFDFAGSALFTASRGSDDELTYLALADEIYLPSSVTYIPDNFFGDEGTACKVYYAGTEEQWHTLKIGEHGNSNYANDKVALVYEYSE